MPSPPGHPRHQLRTFTVTARRNARREHTVTVDAQTEHDALLRAGMILAGLRYPLGCPVPTDWTVTGVTDPAPRTWTPPAEPGDGYKRLSATEPDLHEHRQAGQILTHEHPAGATPHGYYGHPQDLIPFTDEPAVGEFPDPAANYQDGPCGDH